MVSVTPKSRSFVNGTANDATPVEQSFIELYNNDNTLALAVTTLENSSLSVNNIRLSNFTTCPVFINDTSFSVAQVQCTNSLNDGFITKNTSTIIDLNNVGLSGISQSTNLSGTVSVSASSTAVTGVGTSFTTQFQTGDVIRTNGGQARRIVTITNATSLTVESVFTTTENGVVYRRGGRAPNTWYHLYAIASTSVGNLTASTRNVAGNDVLIDLPSGYVRSRQLALSFRTDANSNIVPFYVAEGWPQRPTVLYRDFERVTATYQILASSLTSGFQTTSLSTWLPATSRLGLLSAVLSNATGSGSASMRPTGSTVAQGVDFGDNFVANLSLLHNHIYAVTNNLQQVDYRVTGGSLLSLNSRGYIITEVI
jgi:hypothetical protein